MADPAKRRATYDDLLAVPEHLVAEIIDGELFTQARPASLHALAASTLGREIGRFHRGGPGGWVILDEPELHFRGGDVLVPDLAGWRRERMPEMPDAAAFELVPDWVCEVLSTNSTEAVDRHRKMPIYARERVGHIWLVNPSTRILEVYTLARAAPLPPCWMLTSTHEGSEKVAAPPFSEAEIDLAPLWQR
jgi:Uma2 family endonuclease